jgi:hypothetical protein
MDPCPVFLIDMNGVKRAYQANLNHKLGTFLRLVNTLTGITNESVSVGDIIYGADNHQNSLRNLGFRPGIDVELMSSFAGGYS